MANDNIKNSKQKRFILRTWHLVVAIIAVVVVAVVAVSCYFVWDRWDRYNDAQEIQGEWYVMGTSIPIKITGDMLDFNADTSYRYTLDDKNKTITFKLGNMEGMAHYCFFEDRQVLVIMDGKDFTQWGSAGEDLLVTLQEFVSLSSGRIPQYPSGDGVIVLTRKPNKFGWGDYSYAFKDPEPEPESGSGSQDSSGDDSTKPEEPSANTDGTAGDEPANLDEGQPRDDDPFGSVADTPMSEPAASGDGEAGDSGSADKGGSARSSDDGNTARGDGDGDGSQE